MRLALHHVELELLYDAGVTRAICDDIPESMSVLSLNAQRVAGLQRIAVCSKVSTALNRVECLLGVG